ncbi:MAG TPA: DJ-1/PfpI family protein [Solirubrobacteraceae bacterium]|nr:DJ-1/PfpI family protein [Solirubrobacteraceae bacterium]
MRIEIPLFDGFDEVDAIAPFEVLGNAAFVRDVEVELVGAHGPGEVVAAHGMRVLTSSGLTGSADLVLVPGGGWRELAGSPRAVRREYDDGRLPARLRELHAAGATIASVCTGAMLLARAGITDGRPATTARPVLDDLAATGALVDREARVVDDGDLLTCGGVTSGLDLALHLVEREWGPELAHGIATLMEHERRGPVAVTAPA